MTRLSVHHTSIFHVICLFGSFPPHLFALRLWLADKVVLRRIQQPHCLRGKNAPCSHVRYLTNPKLELWCLKVKLHLTWYQTDINQTYHIPCPVSGLSWFQGCKL